MLQLALPLYSMQVFDRVLASGSGATLVALSIIAATLVVSGTLLDGLRAQMLVRLANTLERHWQESLLRAAFRPDRPHPAGLGPFRDLETVKNCVAGPGMAALLDLPWSSFFVLAVFLLAPSLGWLNVLAMGLLLALAVLGEFLSARWSREGQAQMTEAQRLLETSLAARDAVLSMGFGESIRQRIAVLRDRAGSSQSRSLDRAAWSAAAARGLRNLLQLAIVAAAASLVLSEEIPAGVIVAASMLFARALAPIERITSAYRQLRAAREAFLRLATPEEGARTMRGRVLSLPRLTGKINVAGLTGGRSPRAAVKLANISFGLAAGEIMAVVGPSGAGKSTLVQTLVGITTPTSGTVRLDDAAVADWDPEQLGRQVGYLPQESHPLDGTVAEVIARFGPIDDAKVVAAAQRVGAHEIFLRLPQGYQTVVSRLDQGMSAGERQRVALAQAFYDDPMLLVLDEPTTTLDSEGEKAVLRAILSARQRGATVVVVSRSKDLLNIADHLLMLEKGRMTFFKDRAQLDEHVRLNLIAAHVGSDGQPKLAFRG